MPDLTRRSLLAAGLAPLFPAIASAAPGLAIVREDALPAGTRDMLGRIRAAAQTGDVRRLRIAIERNELPPIFARGLRNDPITILRERSVDGDGREMLHILSRVLAAPAAAIRQGAAPAQYVWPAYATVPHARRSPEDRAAGWGLVRVADIGISTVAGEPILHRVIIGADGTWQLFATG